MNITLIAARAYQCQTGCSNAQAVAYVHLIKAGLRHTAAEAVAPVFLKKLMTRWAIIQDRDC